MNQNGISNIYIDQLMNKISWSFRPLYLNDFICVKIITNFIRCKNTTTNNNNNDMSIFDDK